MTRTLRLLPLLTALVLLGAGQASAEMIDFGYSWSAPTSVFTGTNPTTLDGKSTGSVALAVVDPGSASATPGSTTPTFVPGATLTTTSSATTVPDTFSSPFSMKLHLTDSASSMSGDLTFAGTLAGTLTRTTSQLNATLSSPFTQTLTLGGNVYAVTIDPTVVNLPVPGATSPAAIDARVTVASSGTVTPPPTHNTPEPSGLLLAGLGLPLLAAARRWRRAKAAAPA